MSYLTKNYKGQYRIIAPYDLNTNQFGRKLDGTFEDIDCYIKCRNNIQIFHYGHSILQAYIPSLIRGRNIIKNIYADNIGNISIFTLTKESLDKNSIYSTFDYENMYQSPKLNKIVFDIEETDSELLFKFNSKQIDIITNYIMPITNGANISPFSSKNLPKNKDYKIPDEELQSYKIIIKNIPKERILALSHMTNNFLKSLVVKKNTWDDIKADMSRKGLKGKEYIHSIGKWEEYLDYLKESDLYENIQT